MSINKNLPFLDVASQNSEVRSSLIQVFEEILDSGVYISGPRVEVFEKSFSEAHGTNFTVATNSGTSALIVSLQALGVKPGDEVLVPGMTFIATIEAVVSLGAIPVLVDVDAFNWNLNVQMAKEKITSKTKAMIFVHLHGNPAGIIEARKFCKDNNLFLIEDAAQAHLAEVDLEKVGNFGDVAAFSFYPGKNLGAIGEGGCLTTRNPKVYENAKLIRNWGSEKKYVHEVRGNNYRMDEIQAAFLTIKLRELDRWTFHRENLSKIYNSYFDSVDIQRPFTAKGIRHSFHIYSILVNRRDELKQYLLNNLIESGIHYPTDVYNMKPWKRYFVQNFHNPVSEKLSKNFLSLPLSEQHTEDDINKVIKVIDEFINN